MAKQIAAEMPQLAIVGWETKVADEAAIAFSKGFYRQLGAQLQREAEGSASICMQDAFAAGRHAFHEAGFVYGDPDEASERGSVHGKYGILMPSHALVARFSAKIKARSRSPRPPANSELNSLRRPTRDAEGKTARASAASAFPKSSNVTAPAADDGPPVLTRAFHSSLEWAPERPSLDSQFGSSVEIAPPG